MYSSFIKLSLWIIPIFLVVVIIHGYVNGVKIFTTFVEGGKEGVKIAIKLIPYIVGIFVAIGVFRESGALEILTELLRPVLKIFKIPGEVLPLFIVRPLSGPASLGITADLIERFGPDSFIARLAATIGGSTDTTFYILAIYFASVGIKKTRYALPVGLIADIVGFLAAVYICRHFFL